MIINFMICLFAVIFEEGAISNHLIVYPRAQNENSKILFWGDLHTKLLTNHTIYIKNNYLQSNIHNFTKNNVNDL